jgi:hypothetical protein
VPGSDIAQGLRRDINVLNFFKNNCQQLKYGSTGVLKIFALTGNRVNHACFYNFNFPDPQDHKEFIERKFLIKTGSKDHIIFTN